MTRRTPSEAEAEKERAWKGFWARSEDTDEVIGVVRVCYGWKRVGVEKSEEKGRDEMNDGVLVVCGVNWAILYHCVVC